MVRGYTSLSPQWFSLFTESLLSGMGPVPWPDSTGRFEAGGSAARRQKAGWERNEEEGSCLLLQTPHLDLKGKVSQTGTVRLVHRGSQLGNLVNVTSNGDKYSPMLVYRCVCVLWLHIFLHLGETSPLDSRL